ncbi:MAG: fumarylacetoacetase [Gemmatimonadetes bacterium]|nr:MAG: fumarylacetoacetase [Gemmatimonadota bacterium]
MTLALDESHRADLRSWVESANASTTDFPIQNLPLGCLRVEGGARPGVAIGDRILDLSAARPVLALESRVLDAIDACVAEGALNPLLALGRPALHQLRAAVSDLLRAGTSAGERARSFGDSILVPLSGAELALPIRVGDYTDFYASIDHARNVGSMFRPDNALLPNYKWVPIGYHGRASSVVTSGSSVRRPSGQRRDEATSPPTFGPSVRLDYELEVGAIIADGNALGAPIALAAAEQHVAGLCLVNDWSARDIQAWEYQPLGPFLAKSFATTISPWIVTLDALAPFRVAAVRPSSDPAPLPYLDDEEDRAHGGFDITLEVLLSSRRMRDEGQRPLNVSVGSFATMYWTLAQLVAHHTSNGCNLRPGDLLASGTVSGATKESRGCLLERTWRGTEPLALPTGELRRFLEDGDEVIMRASCERTGQRRIGFGECRGIVSG